MTILIGPRQVGKTYLMRQMQEKLRAAGKKTVWLSLDNSDDGGKFATQATFLASLELAVGKTRAFVFIDEIQRKTDAGIFLKGIFDRNLSYKFVVSGSGSLELKAKVAESLAGRKQMFPINPVSFEEFVNFKTDYQYEDQLQNFFALEGEKTERLLAEYMVFGGYPRVVLGETTVVKQAEMQEIYRSYVDKDIRALLHLERTDEFTKLLKILAASIGGLTNITELSSTVDLDSKTIRQYLKYLEQTYIIKRLTPFHRNTRSELTKMPMYYFVDLGLRNWLLSLFGLPEIPPPLAGHLFENLVFNILIERLELSPAEIHFWRSRDQAEVDFVLESGLTVLPMEVKYAKLQEIEIPRSFKSFLSKYQPQRGYLVHLGKKRELRVEGTIVTSIPFYGLTSENLASK